jgi:hypothetical protein
VGSADFIKDRSHELKAGPQCGNQSIKQRCWAFATFPGQRFEKLFPESFANLQLHSFAAGALIADVARRYSLKSRALMFRCLEAGVGQSGVN